ncbi:predicted protein [Postia placenta Mad-698-R]|nr:predicted protein [Postia placenta Mad-698-R]
MLLDLAHLRELCFMDSSVYLAHGSVRALNPQAFRDMYGPPEPNGRFEDVKLGDQGYWYSTVSYQQDLTEHLSCDTLEEGEAVLPKILHCLTKRWWPAVQYHIGYKCIWLNAHRAKGTLWIEAERDRQARRRAPRAEVCGASGARTELNASGHAGWINPRIGPGVASLSSLSELSLEGLLTNHALLMLAQVNPKLKKLSVTMSRGDLDPMDVFEVLARLSNLQTLEISDATCPEEEQRPRSQRSRLPVVASITWLDFHRWWDVPGLVHIFPNVRELCISRCDKPH